MQTKAMQNFQELARVVDGSTVKSLGRITDACGMTPRHPQIEMACAIDRAFEKNVPIIVPADTGVGKSLVYASAIDGHINNFDRRRVLVSTSTKVLQSQLMRDLPGWLDPVSVVDIRGKKNYRCLVKQRGAPIQYVDITANTQDEFEGEDWEWETHLSVSADECLGAKCQVRAACPSVRAMERLQSAQVVVTNHTMLALNMQFRFLEQEEPFDLIVIDEAHDFESALQDSYEATLTPGRLSWLYGRLKKVATTDIDFLQRASKALTPFIHSTLKKEPAIRLIAGSPEHAEVDNFLGHLHKCLDGIRLDPLSPRVESAKRLISKLKNDLKILNSESTNICLSLSSDPKPSLSARPIDVSTVLPQYIAPSAMDGHDHPIRTILTSATIPVDLPTRLGLDGSKFDCKAMVKLDIPTYFDYQKQGLLFVAPKTRGELAYQYKKPNHGMIGAQLSPRSQFLKNVVDLVPGGCLLLFASRFDMDSAYKVLNSRLNRTCLKQGQKPNAVLIEAFREDISSVLFATRSFEQGVDFPGETLQCVYFDRIPNPPPNDIWTSALTAHYGNYGLAHKPTVHNRMKQAAGRAIRSSTDKALIVVLDHRFENLARVLQPFRFTTHTADVVDWMQEINLSTNSQQGE